MRLLLSPASVRRSLSSIGEGPDVKQLLERAPDENPAVSIIIPVHNGEVTVLRALSSAQNQTLREIEIIVVDDASTDETAALVKQLMISDPRVRLVSHAVNRGPAAARNLALEHSRGEWVALLDADDEMAPDRLEQLLSVAEDNDVMVADNLMLYDREAGKDVGVGIDPSILRGGLRLATGGFVEYCQTNRPGRVDFGWLKPILRASHIRRHSLVYDDDVRYGEDFQFYLDVLLAGGSLLVVPEAYYRYTERTGSVSGIASTVSRTNTRLSVLEAHTRALSVNPRYESVADGLRRRADAIQLLPRWSRLSQLPRLLQITHMGVILSDAGLRSRVAQVLRYRAKKAIRPLWEQGELLRDTRNLSIGQGLKLILQAVYFVLIARSLGPGSYGAFIALTALTGIISPFVGLGAGPLFLKNVRAGRRTPQVCWGNGLVATLLSGVVSSFGIMAICRVVFRGLPISLVTAICISDLLLIRVVDLASFGFAASGKMGKTATQNTLMSLLRCMGIGLLAMHYHRVSLAQWTWMYLATGVVGAAFAFQQGTTLWGRPRTDTVSLIGDAREGCLFSISTSAQTIYNDIDKTMLARLSTLSATGAYGAAYRIIDTSLTPLRSLVSAAYPQFFRLGVDGVGATYGYAKRLIRKALIFGIADFLALVLLAPLIPVILGPRYADVVAALRLLALIPIMRCVHWFLADALSGANAQGIRTAAQVGVAVLNIGLNFLILPRWSWQGAVWTSLVSDAVLLAVLYILVRHKVTAASRREMVQCVS
jgi:O-antigen/teichoic acid export membrane protein/glycosyltransferase involved in cell wall biosynthesis